MLDEVFKTGLQNKARSSAIDFTDAEQTTDEQLVRAVLDGDDLAFAEIFDRYRIVVTRVVGRFFRDRVEIEEHVQQSFAKIFFSLKDFRGAHGKSFPAWATRVAINVCYDEFRRRGRRPENSLTEFNEDTGILETLSDNKSVSAEMTAINAELAEKILSSLDPLDRMAMTMVYSHEYSLSDTADLLRISTGNLKSRLFRCRNNIRQRFGHLFT